ncbi:hypothetical protein [Streptomyces syringium]|uniref:hypothetical protein n=1 Tax=Streptomyces syringium TaxID=76729 RepID=UPI0033D59ED4
MRKEQGGRSRTAGLAVLATALGGVLLVCALAALSAAAASRPGPWPPTAAASTGVATGSPSATPAAAPTAGAKPVPPLPRPMPPPTARPTVRPHAGPVAGDGHELAHSGPPMSASMAFGGALVMLGAGLALVVLYRSRYEG